MDLDQRERLIERRRLERLRRERAERSCTFRRVARALCGAGVRGFSKILPAECQRIASRFAHLPGRDERFLWPPDQCRGWRTDDERDRLLRKALGDCTAMQEPVSLIFHPYEAGLRIDAERLAQSAPIILADLYQTLWISSKDCGQWLIEVAFGDQEVCHSPRV